MAGVQATIFGERRRVEERVLRHLLWFGHQSAMAKGLVIHYAAMF